MIRGSMVALITPFNEDGSVNYDKLRELVEWHIAEQTDAIRCWELRRKHRL